MTSQRKDVWNRAGVAVTDRGYGVLGLFPGIRAWGDAHPAATAAVQGLLFGLLLGVFMAFTSTHHSVGRDVFRAAFSGVAFGLMMWAINAVRVIRRRRSDRA